MAPKKIILRIFSTPFIILSFISFIISFLFLVQTHFVKFKNRQPHPELNTQLTLSITPTPTPHVISSSPPTDIPANMPTYVILSTSHYSNPQSSPTPKTVSPSKSVITVRLEEPKGNFKFTLYLPDSANPCSVLNSLKEAGKLNSLTIIHYGPPLNSDYVKEIDGYSDNWTFELDGEKKPAGCSNYSLSPGSSVKWRFN